MCLFAASLTQRVAAADMDRHPALQIRQREIDAAITAISSAQQRKQRLVLVDGQQLAVTQSPALRRKVKTKDLDFGQEWFSHYRCSLSLFAHPTLPAYQPNDSF